MNILNTNNLIKLEFSNLSSRKDFACMSYYFSCCLIDTKLVITFVVSTLAATGLITESCVSLWVDIYNQVLILIRLSLFISIEIRERGLRGSPIPLWSACRN